MNGLKIFAAAAGASLFASFGAAAATINFADYATGNEGGLVNGEANNSVNFDGTVISFRAGYDLTTTGGGTLQRDFYPYFDGPSGGKPGGLGVCRSLDGAGGTNAPGAECADAGDDSIDGDIGIDEGIALFFAETYNLTGLSFNDGEHNSLNDSQGLIEYFFFGNGVNIANGITTFQDLVLRALAGEFIGVDIVAFGYVDTEFYLESISDVPIPGALPLMLAGLAGLRLAGRKKKKLAA